MRRLAPSYCTQSIFLAMGPDFQKGMAIEKGEIINAAPTFAKVLGISLPDADGRPFDEILIGE